MALDISNVSATAKDRISSYFFGQYAGLNKVLGSVIYGSGGTYFRGKYLPLLKELYTAGGSTNNDIRIEYTQQLNAILGTRHYGYFTHINYYCFYTVVKNFRDQHKFSPLLVPENSSQNLLDYIKAVALDSLYYAAVGPFHTSDPPFKITGNLSIDNTVYPTVNTDTRFQIYVPQHQYALQHNINAPNNPNSFSLFKGDVTGGNGLSALLKLIETPPNNLPGSVDRDSGYYDDIGRGQALGRTGAGWAIFAYNRNTDIQFTIVRKQSDSNDHVDIDKIADMIEALGITEAVFCDGSDSVFLLDFEVPATPRLVVDSITTDSEKNAAGTGLKACLSVRKEQ